MVQPQLNDPRDAIMLDLMFNITVVVLPSVAFQFFMPDSVRPYATYTGMAHFLMVYIFFLQAQSTMSRFIITSASAQYLLMLYRGWCK